jgi:flagellar hook-associated protein 2
MTIQLSQVTTAPVEIDVSTDLEAVRSNLKSFVDAYNMLNGTLANATRYDAGTKTAGPLQGDATATGLQNALRGMMRSVTASSPFSRLSDIGIEGGALTKQGGLIREASDMQRVANDAKKAAAPKADKKPDGETK